MVATYELFNINRTRLEKLIHRVFGSANVDLEIKDRFGLPVVPREWFLVPLFVIDEAITRVRDGSIVSYRGRKPSYNRDQLDTVRDLFSQGAGTSDIARAANLTRQTVLRIKADPAAAEAALSSWKR